MARNSKKPRGTQPQGPDAIVGADTEAAGPDEVLVRVRQHLAAGQPEKALETIRLAKIKSDSLTNAAGVCQLRLGNAEGSLRTFRGLVVAGDVRFRDDVPPLYKLNFAAALLAAGNTGGFLTALHDVGDTHPAAERYRDAYRRWLAGHSRWQRFRMAIGGEPPRPFAADFPMGEV
jgi:hypothetical protein